MNNVIWKRFNPCLFLIVFIALQAPIAQATSISKIEANDTIGTAQNVDGLLSVGLNTDILNSETVPWVSISAVGNGTFDYYSFSVTTPGLGIFDIDFGIGGETGTDTELFLFAADGSELASNDDGHVSLGAGGSTSNLDAYLSYTFTTAGLYIIGVGRFNSYFCVDSHGICGSTVDHGDTYTLQLSLAGYEDPGENHQTEIPEPASVLLLGVGLLGIARYRRQHAKR